MEDTYLHIPNVNTYIPIFCPYSLSITQKQCKPSHIKTETLATTTLTPGLNTLCCLYLWASKMHEEDKRFSIDQRMCSGESQFNCNYACISVSEYDNLKSLIFVSLLLWVFRAGREQWSAKLLCLHLSCKKGESQHVSWTVTTKTRGNRFGDVTHPLLALFFPCRIQH